MRTIHAKCNAAIPLGRVGENDAAVVVFDVSRWAETYGDGTFELVNLRSGETDGYYCDIEQIENEVRWTVKSTDLTNVGYGKCELIYTVGGTVAKSVIFSTVVLASLTGNGSGGLAWSDIEDKPFERLGNTLKVVDGTLDVNIYETSNPQGGNTLIVGR